MHDFVLSYQCYRGVVCFEYTRWFSFFTCRIHHLATSKLLRFALTPIRDIEKVTGINFFTDLSPAEQNSLELRLTNQLWSTIKTWQEKNPKKLCSILIIIHLWTARFLKLGYKFVRDFGQSMTRIHTFCALHDTLHSSLFTAWVLADKLSICYIYLYTVMATCYFKNCILCQYNFLMQFQAWSISCGELVRLDTMAMHLTSIQL